MRGHVAMSGNFGYELDPNNLSSEEKEAIRQQVSTYSEIRGLVQTGLFYRLRSPFEDNDAAWILVSEDGDHAALFYFKILAKPNAPLTTLRLRGLDPQQNYRVRELDQIFGGDVLMQAGVLIPFGYGDFQSLLWHLDRVS